MCTLNQRQEQEGARLPRLQPRFERRAFTRNSDRISFKLRQYHAWK